MTPERPAPQQRDPQPGLVIARPFGIPVYISPYWFLIAGVFILLYSNSLQQAVHGNMRYVVAAVFVVLLYASVLVHELSHCVVARAFDLPVRRVLLYHVVSGDIKAADVVKLSSAKTLNGKSIRIRVSGMNVFVNSAKVTKVDVAATNGVIHVINRVLIPPAK